MILYETILQFLATFSKHAAVGSTTLIGTPTNIMLSGILSDSYNFEITF